MLYHIIPQNSAIRIIYRKIYWKIVNIWRDSPKNWDFDILDSFSKCRDNVQFIQIGSNDGTNGDPIHDYVKANSWRGVLVEPIPYLYEKLKKNYQGYHHELKFENSAISNRNGKMKFYRLKETAELNIPSWYDQLGSFNKDVVLKHRNSIPNFDSLFMEDIVNAITIEDLITKYSIEDVNLLHIDTEGYDFEILKYFPFSRFDVEVIMFEHKHLTLKDYKEAIKLLKLNQFVIGRINSSDTIAVKSNVLKELKCYAGLV